MLKIPFLKDVLDDIEADGLAVHVPGTNLIQRTLCQIALVLMLSLGTFLPGAAASPLPDSSEAAEDYSGSNPYVTNLNLEPLVRFLRSAAVEQLKQQLCEYFSMCDGDMSSLQTYTMELPQIRKEDGCFRRGFRKEKCLTSIVRGLKGYRRHLLFVNQLIGNGNQQVGAILGSISNLVDLLLLQRNVKGDITQQDESNQEALNPDMSSQTEWDRQVRVHVILRKFAFFMESTVRAIRFMKSVPGAV
eukprot:gi/632938001/ref/XP_007901912.1/ PREDICTED: interleukin-6-like [Callorhinchus milii]